MCYYAATSGLGHIQVARIFYTLLFTLLVPFMVLRLWWRGRLNPGYRQRTSERFGLVGQKPASGGIWIHAVSVGETQAAAPLIRKLQQQYPGLPLLVTTTTPTGSDQVRRLFGDSVWHQYLPYDLPWLLGRFLRRIQPSVLVVMETELWPNLIAACNQRQIPVLLANARLSERSARGYRRFAALTGPMLRGLTRVACQNDTDGQRFLALGLPAERLAITGSIKFDVAVDDDLAIRADLLRQSWGQERRVLVLASSHVGEDEALLDILPGLQQDIPDLLLMLVPRHPERFHAVLDESRRRGFTVWQRTECQSQQPLPQVRPQVYLADTMGEMMLLLAASDLVIVGGSLFDIGGHNPIEPAALGKAVLMGPYGFNFAGIIADMERAGALRLTSIQHLQGDVLALLKNPDERQKMAENGRNMVAANRGAVDRMAEMVQALRQVI
jgi:3-deoxy-D-manno-octulosonic-acid transferase